MLFLFYKNREDIFYIIFIFEKLIFLYKGRQSLKEKGLYPHPCLCDTVPLLFFYTLLTHIAHWNQLLALSVNLARASGWARIFLTCFIESSAKLYIVFTSWYSWKRPQNPGQEKPEQCTRDFHEMLGTCSAIPKFSLLLVTHFFMTLGNWKVLETKFQGSRGYEQ